MRKKLTRGILFLSIAAFAAQSAERVSKVIYGTDTRTDAALSTNKDLRNLAISVAGRLRKSEVSVIGGLYQLPNTTLYSSMGVCKNERFAAQRVAVECSGFLIAPDVLVTAGHCVEDANDCASNYWVFDFLYTTKSLAEDQVFECKEIISQQLNSKNDYAIIRLKKKALGRTPLVRRTSGSIALTDPLAVIGHPSGLPLKISDGGKVRNVNTTKNFFVSELDTYGGNSGSPVINSKTLKVEGILVRGETDYVYNASKGCSVSKVCATGTCRGEDVQKITALPAAK